MKRKGYEELGTFVDNNFHTSGEMLKIIVDNKIHCEMQGYEFHDYITLGKCLEIAKEKLGYDGTGTIEVLDESYLDGMIYRYGNFDDKKLKDKWQIVGIMQGFVG